MSEPNNPSIMGLTLRDLLACFAPKPPRWFWPVKSENLPQAPSPPDALSEQGLQLACEWLAHGHAFDIGKAAPPADRELLMDWAGRVKAAFAAHDSFEVRTQATRAVAWPWVYADMLLRTRKMELSDKRMIVCAGCGLKPCGCAA